MKNEYVEASLIKLLSVIEKLNHRVDVLEKENGIETNSMTQELSNIRYGLVTLYPKLSEDND